MNRANTANQLSLFDALGAGPTGRVRVHVAINDRARRQAIAKILARSPKLSVLDGPYGYDLEADVRIIDDVATTSGTKSRRDEAVTPGVIIGSDIGEESLLDALHDGVAAWVPPDVDRKTLEDVLIRVAGGECMLLGDIGRSKKASRLLVTKLRQIGRTANGSRPATTTNPFTDRERQIITGIAKGHSSPVIAGELSLSVQTVKNYVTGILTKTGARNRAHAVAVATDRGWLG